MAPTDPFLGRRRRQVLAGTTIILAIAVLLGVKIVTMTVTQQLGERAWRSGDLVAASRYFAVNQRLNFGQRWIAPFNSGVVDYSRNNFGDAASWFEKSFALAPDSAKCKVALNWAWSLEASGDELAASGDDTTAGKKWKQAEGVLELAVGCDQSGASAAQPTAQPQDQDAKDDSTDSTQAPAEEDQDAKNQADSQQDQRDATSKRLAKKQDGNRSESEPDTTESADQSKATKLADRNREGAKTRQQDRDKQGEESDDAPRRTW